MNIRRGIFKMLLGFILFIILLSISIIIKPLGLNEKTSLFVIVLVAVALCNPIQKWLANITDKYLFQKDYNFYDALNQISDGFDNMQRDKTYPDDLKKYITSAVIDKMRLENAVILEQNEFQDEKAIKKRLKLVYSQMIPLNGQPYWLLLTGKKKSGTGYSKQDRNTLSILSNRFSQFISIVTLYQTIKIGKQINEILIDTN